MSVVISFPRQTGEQETISYPIADPVLHELLRKAVVAHRAGDARVPGSLGHRHHLAVSCALVDAIETVMGVPGIATELGRCLDAGITDIRYLARAARDYDGPQPA